MKADSKESYNQDDATGFMVVFKMD